MILTPKLMYIRANRNRFAFVCVALYLGFILYQHILEQFRLSNYLPICAFANTETVEAAIRVAAIFPSFPFWFAVWGQDIEYTILDDRIHLIPARGSTHAQGWEITVAAAKQSEFRCEYYFSMDDDLKWFVTETGIRQYYANRVRRGRFPPREPTITDVIAETLEHYKPAVMVFPWPWGDAYIETLSRFNSLHEGQIVQPATGFDNGCIVFHESIVDFFIPIWLGGGFQPRFIVQHTVLNFFIPFMFTGNSIRLNGVSFVNPPNVRHQYDDATQYANFFEPAIKCGTEWGAGLTSNRVKWSVTIGEPPYVFDDVLMISAFFNVTHPAISEHPQIKSRYTKTQISRIEKFSSVFLNRDEACTYNAIKLLKAALAESNQIL